MVSPVGSRRSSVDEAAQAPSSVVVALDAPKVAALLESTLRGKVLSPSPAPAPKPAGNTQTAKPSLASRVSAIFGYVAKLATAVWVCVKATFSSTIMSIQEKWTALRTKQETVEEEAASAPSAFLAEDDAAEGGVASWSGSNTPALGGSRRIPHANQGFPQYTGFALSEPGEARGSSISRLVALSGSHGAMEDAFGDPAPVLTGGALALTPEQAAKSEKIAAAEKAMRDAEQDYGIASTQYDEALQAYLKAHE